MVRASNEKTNTFYAGCVVWMAVCYWLVSRGLGVIAFVASALLAIWIFGLRDKFEGETTMSAYNVFNKGGKSILGGLTGEQVDEQMRGGMRYGKPVEAKVDEDNPLTSVVKTTPKKLSESDKLKRRSAAAAAAEKRLSEQQRIAEGDS